MIWLWWAAIALHTAAPEPSLVWSKFQGATASSTTSVLRTPETTLGNFDPENALTRGSAFWSSAEKSSDQASLSLYSQKPHAYSGIHIEWKFRPTQVRVMGSMDGDPQQETLAEIYPWTKMHLTNNTEETEGQDLLFTKQHFLNRIVVEMKTPQNGENFGVSFVAGLVPPVPLFAIVSGITSPLAEDEYCLQAANGRPQQDTPVVLDSCLGAIASADGRELFHFHPEKADLLVHASSGLVLALKDNDTSGGGNLTLIQMAVAETLPDGSASFKVKPSSQLQIVRAEGSATSEWCLSGRGSKAGEINAAAKPMAVARSDSTMDDLHPPSAAIDGDPSTFWASSPFVGSPSPFVFYSVQLDKQEILKAVEVWWEYAPSKFVIEGSNDGRQWESLSRVEGNAQLITYHAFDELRPFSNYRLVLEEPHPELGALEAFGRDVLSMSSQLAYGIREIKLLKNGVDPIVVPCSKTNSPSDGRELFFFVEAAEFDSELPEILRAKNSDFDSIVDGVTQSIERSVGNKEELLTCRDGLDFLAETTQEGQRRTQAIAEAVLRNAPLRMETYPTTCSSRMVFKSKLEYSPGAADVYGANRYRNDEGFYDVQPRCAEVHLRTFCPPAVVVTDSSSSFPRGVTIPTTDSHPGIENAKGPNAIFAGCREIGFVPLSPKTANLFDLIAKIIENEQHCAHGSRDKFFPVAWSTANAGTEFRDFMQNDATELLREFLNIPAPVPLSSRDVFGYACDQGWTFHYWDDVNMGGLLCEEEEPLADISEAIHVGCTDTIPNASHKFGSISNGDSLVVKCPKECPNLDNTVIGGYKGIYRDDSGVCGILQHARLFQSDGSENYGILHILPGRTSYEGTKGGIESISKKTEFEWPHSIEVSGVYLPCLSKNSSAALAHTANRHLVSWAHSNESSSMAIAPVQRNDLREVAHRWDSASAVSNKLAVRRCLGIQELIVPLANDLRTQSIMKSIGATVHESRALVKPAEKEAGRLLLGSKNLRHYLDTQTSLLHDILGGLLSDFRISKSMVEMRRSRMDQILGLENLSLRTLLISPNMFYESLESFSNPMSQNIAIWERLDLTTFPDSKNDRGLLYNPPSCESGFNPSFLRGSLIMIKDRRFFDSNITLEFFVPPGFRSTFTSDNDQANGLIGVAFRVLDNNQFFFAGFKADDTGTSQAILAKIMGGRMLIVQQAVWPLDWTRSTWIAIKVVSRRDRHHLYVREAGMDWVLALGGQSEELTAGGSAGIFSSFKEKVVFSDLEVRPLVCEKVNTRKDLIPPFPAECSKFEEQFGSSDLATNWVTKTSGADPGSPVGLWRFMPEVLGHDMVLAQLNTVRDEANEIGTQIILNKHRGCARGHWRFSYFAPCDNGRVSSIVRMSDHSMAEFLSVELSSWGTRVRAFSNGSAREIIRLPEIKMVLGAWGVLDIGMSNTSITIDTHQGSTAVEVHVDPSVLPEGGTRVGIGTVSCGGITFSGIRLHS